VLHLIDFFFACSFFPIRPIVCCQQNRRGNASRGEVEGAQRVEGQGITPTLNDQHIGLEALHHRPTYLKKQGSVVAFDQVYLRYDPTKRCIANACFQRNVQAMAFAIALSHLLGSTRARKKPLDTAKSTRSRRHYRFMVVEGQSKHRGGVPKGFLHAVSMVHVEVHIKHASHRVQ